MFSKSSNTLFSTKVFRSMMRPYMNKILKKNRMRHMMKMNYLLFHLIRTSIPFLLLHIKKRTWWAIILLRSLMMRYSMIVEMNKTFKRISMKFLLQKL
jgi:hypothetical protein